MGDTGLGGAAMLSTIRGAGDGDASRVEGVFTDTVSDICLSMLLKYVRSEVASCMDACRKNTLRS